MLALLTGRDVKIILTILDISLCTAHFHNDNNQLVAALRLLLPLPSVRDIPFQKSIFGPVKSWHFAFKLLLFSLFVLEHCFPVPGADETEKSTMCLEIWFKYEHKQSQHSTLASEIYIRARSQKQACFPG